jgi:thiol-disulfide isomerase/thioredoxin
MATATRRLLVGRVRLGLLTALLVGCAGAPKPPEVTHLLSGNAFPMEAFHGQVVLLNFWATWCEPCLEEFPQLAKVAGDFGDQVAWVAMYYLPRAQAEAQVTGWLRNKPEALSSRVAWGNSSLHELFPHPRLPTTYVVGRAGVVVTKFVGSITTPEQVAELRAAIETGLHQPLDAARSPGAPSAAN